MNDKEIYFSLLLQYVALKEGVHNCQPHTSFNDTATFEIEGIEYAS